jgi:ornithine decarboxylase
MAYEKVLKPKQWQKIREFSKDKETPFLVVDLNNIREKYQEMKRGFGKAKIYYAVKANPANEVLSLLNELGACFDIASRYELDKVMAIGVEPERLSFGNTIKKVSDIKYFYEKGVRLFASDSEADIRNLAKHAPKSKVYVRVLVEGSETADWPLSRKFGCQAEMAIDLMLMARDAHLNPVGLSFHVGSQQREIATWDAAIAKARFIAERLRHFDIPLQMLNMGGGFPAQYITRNHKIDRYASEINRFLAEDFGTDQPEIILEPGRSLVGEAGVLISEIVLISRKSRDDLYRWIFTDVGIFGGLIETLGESIKYPIHVEKDGEEEEVVIAGPTCDSMDIMYENHRYPLPLSLEIGDRLYWLSTGAYTTSYSSVEFNGFPPLKAYYID